MHRYAHPPPSGSLVLPLFLVWRKSCLNTCGPATSGEREDEESNNDYFSNYPSPQKGTPALTATQEFPSGGGVILLWVEDTFILKKYDEEKC